MTPAELEAKLGSLGVFEELIMSKGIILRELVNDDASGVLDAHQFLAHIKLSSANGTSRDSVETLLKGILELVQAKGVAIDEAFRHFDTDGMAAFSSEFELAFLFEGFDSIPTGAHKSQSSQQIR